MRAFLSPLQSRHDPQFFMANGVRLENPEKPERIERLRQGAAAAGCTFEVPNDVGLGPIGAVHPPRYVRFLERIHTRWSRMEEASAEVIPNVFPDGRASAGYPRSAIGQAGFHQADTACPIGAGTFAAACASAHSAVAAVDAVMAGNPAAYALCRPPGHHAFGEMAAGFCFFNNAAIAAERAISAGCRPAILDVDVHHGNGTQAIFYGRGDVFTVSIHADPIRFYPFFWGYGHEYGEAAGQGANLNLPLPRGTADDTYLATVEEALAAIRAFGADILILALGLDAHEADPLKGLAVTTGGFSRLGALIASCGLPVAVIQEGGYLQDALADNLTATLAPLAALPRPEG